MNQKQENKLKMYLAVHEVLKENEASWNTLPAFVKAFTGFDAKVAEINQSRLVQENKVTGITQDKAARKIQLAEAALKVAGAVQAYANDNDSNELFESVNYSLSELKFATDTAALERAQAILNKAAENVSALADYGITKDGL